MYSGRNESTANKKTRIRIRKIRGREPDYLEIHHNHFFQGIG